MSTLQKSIFFQGARVVTWGASSYRAVYVQKDKIVRKSVCSTEIDCSGLVLTPGLIDIQINGYGGREFSEGDEAIKVAQTYLPKYGVTSFVPTLPTLSMEAYRASVLKKNIELSRKRKGANVLGWHLEGPFLNPMACGAHNFTNIQNDFDSSFWREVFSSNVIRIMTLAPEFEYVDELLELLFRYHIVAAIGHSQATSAQLRNAYEKGVRFATHFYNAMLPFHHRAPGIVGAVLGDKLFGATLISDLYHVHPSAIRMAFNSVAEEIALISDGSHLIDSGKKEGIFAGMPVRIDGEKVLSVSTGGLAGSLVPLNEQLLRFMKCTGCGFEKAIQAASEVPALFLGLSKGSIDVGYDADILLWEEEYVIATIIGGELIWSTPEFLKRVHEK